MRIATERAADRARIRAVLDRKREHDRGVPGVGVSGAVALMIREKQLPNTTTSEPAHGSGVAQAVDLDLERLGCAPVWEAFTIHGALADLARTPSMSRTGGLGAGADGVA